MAILGLDIGGANIKAADIEGHAISRPFAIWRQPNRLRDEISSILREFPLTSRIALTMTAELADCFSKKSEGVRFIIDTVESCTEMLIRFSDDDQNPERKTPSEIGATASLIQPQSQFALEKVAVWATDGRFLRPVEAPERVLNVAAANWHALATWCGSVVPGGAGLLVDIGSTTTDIIPLIDGRPFPIGLTDIGRLQSGELSYSGVWRTPICAIAHSVPFRDGYCPLAAELFATTLDIHLLLDHVPEDSLNLDTANGKPATRAAAHDRIARMLCCDREEVTLDDAIQIARFLADVQRQRLAGSLERVVNRLPSVCEFVILSGSGEFLARQLLVANRRTMGCRLISLADRMSAGVSEAACRFAVAQLGSIHSLQKS